MMNVVECIALTKVFQDFWGRDKVRAVDNLDMEIRPGEIFGLLGPNGSGKSTTIKMLLGLLYPTSGAARVLGKMPTDTAVKAQIGFLPEESYLYRYLNAYETLDYYGRLFKLDRYERKRRTEQLIEIVGLKKAARRPVGTYSKGMARRIGLAQALVNDPDLLILDEPTSGLDPAGTLKVKNVIKQLGDRGKTVILSSHLLADVEDVCDRVVIMYGGRQQATGTVDELLKRQDTTQILAKQLDENTIQRISELVKQSGSEMLRVDHPTDRLEDLFFRVIADAQRQQLATAGAEESEGMPEFLKAKPERQQGTQLVETLVEAGKEKPTAPVMTPVEPAAAPAPAARTEVLEELAAGKRSTPEEQAASEEAEKTAKDEKPKPQPKRDVLDRLMGGDKK